MKVAIEGELRIDWGRAFQALAEKIGKLQSAKTTFSAFKTHPVLLCNIFDTVFISLLTKMSTYGMNNVCLSNQSHLFDAQFNLFHIGYLAPVLSLVRMMNGLD